MRRALLLLVLLSIMAVLAIEAHSWMERNRHQLPWTELDLNAPVGRFTATKIAALNDDAPRCSLLLRQAGALDRPAPARIVSDDCGYRDGKRLVAGNARGAGFSPDGLVTSCPVAAALLLWEERVVQPAARRHFGSGVERFVHAGSYSCRRLYNRDDGPWSEHATADAVDILGFELEDGQRISVLNDWSGDGRKATFLRDVRDGACRLFTTVLSPDYNAAHRDHFHLDVANRGTTGWAACR